MREHSGRQAVPVNLAVHVGQGALLGVLRPVMAYSGLCGPWSSAKFAVVRLANDQILENATGVGAPPPTLAAPRTRRRPPPRDGYAFATGADAPAARSGPGPGQCHASVRAGRQPDMGPAPRDQARRR
ncbi:hypothetical protein [Streptomyces mutabilis]|uniref:hypothetical protein n=1 Tax=Streptomyces mutabilis TaxID=67332 RepID=UPI000A7F2031|nr:hypothetical protein [Streptomyces mutabilis]